MEFNYVKVITKIQLKMYSKFLFYYFIFNLK